MQELISFVLENIWSILFIFILNQNKKTKSYAIVYLAYLMIFGFSKYAVGFIAAAAVFSLTEFEKNARIDSEKLARN